MSQDRIGEQIAAMTPAQRQRLIAEFPQQVGNTDGVPWDMRVAANRVNIAQAIVDGLGDPASEQRTAFYRTLLGEIDDPARSGQRVDRQILAFDPARASLVELNGNLSTAKSVAVLVPGLNTTIEGSAANTQTARRFVAATRGDVATITYLGGPFPARQSGDRARRRRRPAVRTRHGAAAGRLQRGRRPHRRRDRPRPSPSPTSATRTADRSWAPPKHWA